MRILFVGDHACLPHDQEGDLRGLGDGWHVEQVPDGKTAIAAAALAPFDAVVAAPVLADLTSATLLGQIRTLRPETIRIALLDAHGNNRALASRIMGVAHRFLPLPLRLEFLREAIRSLEELRSLLDNPRLRSAIGRIEKLPSPPHLYLRLMHALEEEAGSDAASLARLVAGDPAIAAKVLQLCNSAFFAGGRTITDLRAAVTRLGISTLRDLVLASEVFSAPPLSPARRAAMQRRALLASRIAGSLLPPSSAELGSTAALLADIGLLLPGVRDERQPGRAEQDERPSHTEAGAYLLGLWGLPMPIIEAVALHRQPQRSSVRSFWVTGAVHVATALARGESVDEHYLAQVGMLTRLPQWREQADALSGPAARI